MAGPPGLPFPAATANRTVLNVPTPSPQSQGQPNGRPQAIQLPTGTGYGERQQLQQAQQAVPLPRGPQAPTGGPGPGGGGAGGSGGFTIGQALAHARNFTPPNLPSFTRPTERPNEPVTAGLPGGPPVAANASQGAQAGTIASMLARVAQAVGSPALNQLAQRAQSLGQ